MTLIVHELKSSPVSQQVTADRDVNVVAIRPHIYRHNMPSGTLALKIYDEGNALVATSESITITDIGSMNYFHGHVRFYINAFLSKDQTYTVKLSGTGYSFDESAYVGWVNSGTELAKYIATPTPSKNVQEPLDLEIWERTT